MRSAQPGFSAQNTRLRLDAPDVAANTGCVLPKSPQLHLRHHSGHAGAGSAQRRLDVPGGLPTAPCAAAQQPQHRLPHAGLGLHLASCLRQHAHRQPAAIKFLSQRHGHLDGRCYEEVGRGTACRRAWCRRRAAMRGSVAGSVAASAALRVRLPCPICGHACGQLASKHTLCRSMPSAPPIRGCSTPFFRCRRLACCRLALWPAKRGQHCILAQARSHRRGQRRGGEAGQQRQLHAEALPPQQGQVHATPPLQRGPLLHLLKHLSSSARSAGTGGEGGTGADGVRADSQTLGPRNHRCRGCCSWPAGWAASSRGMPARGAGGAPTCRRAWGPWLSTAGPARRASGSNTLPSGSQDSSTTLLCSAPRRSRSSCRQRQYTWPYTQRRCGGALGARRRRKEKELSRTLLDARSSCDSESCIAWQRSRGRRAKSQRQTKLRCSGAAGTTGRAV